MIRSAWKAALSAAAGLSIIASSQASAASDPQSVSYTIQRSDTLYDLARKYFIGSAAARIVQRVNRIDDPHRIRIGTRLRIPRSLLRTRRAPLRIASFSGPVIIGRATAPVVGAIVDEGSEISTGRGGFITLTGPGGSTVSLPSNSQARILRARQVLLNGALDIDFKVIEGRGAASVEKLEEGGTFKLQTPAAVSAVRGTDFRVSYDDKGGGKGATEVVEGTVAVDSGGDSIATRAGYGIAITSGKLGALERLLPAPAVVNSDQVQTAETLVFTLEPVSGATGYRTQIARDAGFLDIIAEEESEGPSASLPGIDNGRFFVRARAISASGIEGQSDSFSFRRKRLGVAATAKRSALDDGFLFAWKPEGDGDTFFAFQLWRADQPGALLIDETGLSGEGVVVTSLSPAIYEWRVAAIQADTDGLLKVWGPAEKLTVTN